MFSSPDCRCRMSWRGWRRTIRFTSSMRRTTGRRSCARSDLASAAIATSSHLRRRRRSLIDACPNAGDHRSFGVGTDSHRRRARQRGAACIVSNTPDVLNDDVANLAIALLLAATRKLVAYDRYVREGRWVKEGLPPLTRGIAGSRIGIVGLGRIGSRHRREAEGLPLRDRLFRPPQTRRRALSLLSRSGRRWRATARR